ncbi:unnamed protein product [Allacma fusca]|uniref:Uncharacterized protein n=1 Tax=Allacma fusca TaxID=39272 RepID=A0A8J2KG42_9HEXA|nr:unnamed protein product [Allacma fusca]
MSLLQAIQALPHLPLCYSTVHELGSTFFQYRQHCAGFLERTLCIVVEDPTEDEINQWHTEFETAQQNCCGLPYACQQTLSTPIKWYTAFSSFLKEELDFVEKEWLHFAERGLQTCTALHQQIMNAVLTIEDVHATYGKYPFNPYAKVVV